MLSPDGHTSSNACRQLQKHHQAAAAKVVALMCTDLVRSKDKWAAGVKDLRELFATVEREGFSRQSQAAWRLHWDHQLYKVGPCRPGHSRTTTEL